MTIQNRLYLSKIRNLPAKKEEPQAEETPATTGEPEVSAEETPVVDSEKPTE